MSKSAAAVASPARRMAAGPAQCVLVVESEAGVGEVLVEQLTADGYRAELARTSEHARTLAGRLQPSAIVVGDLGTRRGALELVREIRDAGASGEAPAAAMVALERRPVAVNWRPGLPIIMHGACMGELDMLRAFDAGADDCLTRPLRYLELRARLRALLRRAEPVARTGSQAPVTVGALRIDPASRAARLYGRPIGLRRLEFELLVHLASDPERVFAKQELLATIWGYRSTGATRTVDSHASRLRRRLQEVERLERGGGRWIVNIWGIGYRLR